MEFIPDDLSAHVAARGGKLHLGFPAWLRLVLRPQTLAVTIGRRIYLGPQLLSQGAGEVEAILVHELEHVRQFAREGLVSFAWRYARDYIRNRQMGMSAFEAYEAIPFEVEARTAENRHRWSKENGGDVTG